MYLHLGQGVVVPYRDVLALFDLDNTSASHLRSEEHTSELQLQM